MIRDLRTRRRLRAHRKPWRLNFGCGTNPLPGFVNVDLHHSAPGVLAHDVRRPFPADPGSAALVYTEHMIEHLTLEEGAAFLRDCRRLLTADGCLRIATPDLSAFIDMYAGRDPERLSDYEAFFRGRNPHLAALPCSPIVFLNAIASDHGHRFVYDEPYLTRLLESCGFTSVERQSIGSSPVPELRNLESHGRVIGERPNEIETMVLEARP